MSALLPVFKTWVPVWLIRLTILLAVLPPLMLLGLYYSNVAETAGYFGMEPADVQFSVLLFYAGLAAYFPLEKRFQHYWATRHFFLLSVLLLTLTYYICYLTRSTPLFMALRLLQGLLCGATGGIGLTLVFSNLMTERARAMGYTVYYGILLCAAPLSGVLAAWVLHHYDFNSLFYAMLYLQLPGVLLVLLIMNNTSLKRKMPLYQLEWPSFVFYLLSLSGVAYVLVYGQQYYWLEDPVIAGLLGLLLVWLTFFTLRQFRLKRPFINLAIFRYKNFILGLLLVIPFYLCRGTLGVTTAVFGQVLELDPLHISALLVVNMLGMILSLMVAVRFVLQAKPMRLIWLIGFGLFLVFHIWMYCLFDTEVEALDFVAPLFIQGLATGALMVPIIIFTVSSVPAAISGSAASMGIAVRFLGYALSIALINFCQLYGKGQHYRTFQEQVTATNPYAHERLEYYKQVLLQAGVNPDQSGKMAAKLLTKALDAQSQLRFAMDYYELVSYGIIGLLLLLALVPYLRRTTVHFRRKLLPN
jgi:MFS transporter, DHA2 family, multidrug resistance protein